MNPQTIARQALQRIERCKTLDSGTALYLNSSITALSSHIERLEKDARAIEDAILIHGPRPDIHRETLARHRKEWPLLWAALDRLRQGITR